MNSIKIPLENSNKIPDNGIEFSFIHFFPVKKPEIKDKCRLLTGTSWFKKKGKTSSKKQSPKIA